MAQCGEKSRLSRGFLLKECGSKESFSLLSVLMKQIISNCMQMDTDKLTS